MVQQKVFTSRLNSAMKTEGVKQVDLIHLAQKRGVKLGKSQLSQYINGKSSPRTGIMEFLADALNVTPE
ncbi:MAG: helix-turn-helix domain-containing protein, partial [Coriobacteriales bacterium]